MGERQTGLSTDPLASDLDIAVGFLREVLAAEYEIAVFRKVTALAGEKNFHVFHFSSN